MVRAALLHVLLVATAAASVLQWCCCPCWEDSLASHDRTGPLSREAWVHWLREHQAVLSGAQRGAIAEVLATTAMQPPAEDAKRAGAREFWWAALRAAVTLRGGGAHGAAFAALVEGVLSDSADVLPDRFVSVLQHAAATGQREIVAALVRYARAHAGAMIFSQGAGRLLLGAVQGRSRELLHELLQPESPIARIPVSGEDVRSVLAYIVHLRRLGPAEHTSADRARAQGSPHAPLRRRQPHAAASSDAGSDTDNSSSSEGGCAPLVRESPAAYGSFDASGHAMPLDELERWFLALLQHRGAAAAAAGMESAFDAATRSNSSAADRATTVAMACFLRSAVALQSGASMLRVPLTARQRLVAHALERGVAQCPEMQTIADVAGSAIEMRAEAYAEMRRSVRGWMAHLEDGGDVPAGSTEPLGAEWVPPYSDARLMESIACAFCGGPLVGSPRAAAAADSAYDGVLPVTEAVNVRAVPGTQQSLWSVMINARGEAAPRTRSHGSSAYWSFSRAGTHPSQDAVVQVDSAIFHSLDGANEVIASHTPFSSESIDAHELAQTVSRSDSAQLRTRTRTGRIVRHSCGAHYHARCWDAVAGGCAGRCAMCYSAPAPRAAQDDADL